MIFLLIRDYNFVNVTKKYYLFKIIKDLIKYKIIKYITINK
jgi:hypothetical protein